VSVKTVEEKTHSPPRTVKKGPTRMAFVGKKSSKLPVVIHVSVPQLCPHANHGMEIRYVPTTSAQPLRAILGTRFAQSTTRTPPRRFTTKLAGIVTRKSSRRRVKGLVDDSR